MGGFAQFAEEVYHHSPVVVRAKWEQLLFRDGDANDQKEGRWNKMTEEQYTRAEALQTSINEEGAKKQRIVDLLEQLEAKKIREKPGKTVEITCTEERLHHDQISKILVDEERFEDFMRSEIERITQVIADLQDEFHGI